MPSGSKLEDPVGQLTRIPVAPEQSGGSGTPGSSGEGWPGQSRRAGQRRGWRNEASGRRSEPVWELVWNRLETCLEPVRNLFGTG